MVNQGYTHIGDFQITSGEVILSDPCYELGEWCQERVGNVKNGTWHGYVAYHSENDFRVSQLFILADGAPMPKASDFSERHEALAVDSGQMGIFDVEIYQNAKGLPEQMPKPIFSTPDETDEAEIFYNLAADFTLSDQQAGVYTKGIVSRTGWGDGFYDALSVNKGNGIEAIVITFIYDEDDF